MALTASICAEHPPLRDSPMYPKPLPPLVPTQAIRPSSAEVTVEVPVEVKVVAAEDETVDEAELDGEEVSEAVAVVLPDVVCDDVPLRESVVVPDELAVLVAEAEALLLALLVTDVVTEELAVEVCEVLGEVKSHRKNVPSYTRVMSWFSLATACVQCWFCTR